MAASNTCRAEIEKGLRDEFDRGLNERVEQELDSTRDDRENALAYDIEAELLEYFEVMTLPDLINDELERTREHREEELAEQIEERMRQEFEDGVEDAIDAAVEDEAA